MALEIVSFGVAITRAWLEKRAFDAHLRDETRTYDGPFAAHGYASAASMLPLLNLLPLRSQFPQGGLRFTAAQN